MPIGIRRYLGHAPHHHSRRELDFLPGFDPIRLAREEAPEWNLGTQQCAGEETALEIAPGVQHVLRVHTGGEFRTASRAAAHFPAGGMRGLESIASVPHLVAQVRCEVA